MLTGSLLKKTLSLILLCVSCLYLPNAGAQQVIVNQGVAVQSLSQGELRSIFAMRLTQWPDGEPIRVMVFEDSDPTHESFSKHILGIFPYRLRRIWDRLVYSGTGTAPALVQDVAEMMRLIRSTPGAIGYIPDAVEGDGFTQVPVK